jgi:acyl transferase domain-containing protein
LSSSQKHHLQIQQNKTIRHSNIPSKLNNRKTIAIVGMSGAFPGAPDLDTFWENLLEGRTSIREVPKERWDAEHFFDPIPQKVGKSCSKWVGMLDDIDQFDPKFFDIHPKEAVSMDPQQRLILEHTWKAMENGGFPMEQLEGKNIGVFIGSNNFEYHVKITSKRPEKIVAHDSLGTSHSVIANRVSHFLKLTGPSFSIDSTCSSSIVALHLACQSLQQGECDMAIVGGVNLALNVSTFISISKTKILSPTGVCRIFDEKSDGSVRGEGVGVVILRPLEQAEKNQDIIHGVLKGTSVQYKGQSLGIMLPSVHGLKQVMQTTWQKRKIEPSTISYMEIGSFGSKISDPIEFHSLMEAFNEGTNNGYSCVLGSVKPNIGHLEAASGIAGLIKLLLIVKHQQIPPMCNLGTINKTIRLETSCFRFNTNVEKLLRNDGNLPFRVAMNSLGFGGTIAHAVVESYSQKD